MSSATNILMGHLRALSELAARQLEKPVSPEAERTRVTERITECKEALRKEQDAHTVVDRAG